MRIIFALIIFLLSTAAYTDILCVKDRVKVRNSAIRLSQNVKLIDGDSCPTRHSLIKDFGEIIDARIAAFAKISGMGEVLSFGGSEITSVSVLQPAPGRYEITFAGNFKLPTTADSEQNRNSLTVNTTAIADNYGSTNNSIEFASTTEIRATVFLWRSDTVDDQNQSGLNITILQGGLT
jgi:hypothetical protein